MGMYDEIRIKYPHPRLSKYKNTVFQTKDLECAMLSYLIDKNGILHIGTKAERTLPEKKQIENFRKDLALYRDSVKRRSALFPLIFFRPKEKYTQTYIKSWRKENYTGSLRFYTEKDIKGKNKNTKYRWIEVNCLFFKGKLKSIKVWEKETDHETDD